MGQEVFQWFQSEAGWIILLAMVVFGIILAIKRQFTALIATAVVFVIAVAFVMLPEQVRTMMETLAGRFLSGIP